MNKGLEETCPWPFQKSLAFKNLQVRITRMMNNTISSMAPQLHATTKFLFLGLLGSEQYIHLWFRGTTFPKFRHRSWKIILSSFAKSSRCISCTCTQQILAHIVPRKLPNYYDEHGLTAEWHGIPWYQASNARFDATNWAWYTPGLNISFHLHTSYQLLISPW